MNKNIQQKQKKNSTLSKRKTGKLENLTYIYNSYLHKNLSSLKIEMKNISSKPT